jgi:Na+/H+-dicarboxylate symporter
MAALVGVAVLVGAVPLKRFATAIAPALLIAFTSRSSMAALPVLMRSVRERLSFEETTTGLLLPFTASVLRVSAPVAQAVAALFVAHAFGIRLEPMQILTLTGLGVMLSFAVPGIPNASFIVMVPVFEALSLPIYAIGLLLAVDVIPDAFKTMLNVTGHLTAATLVANPRGKQQQTVATLGAPTPA